jgi:hypothetical protein
MPVTPRLLRLASALAALGSASAAHAYIGPGVGLGALGVALGVAGSLLLGLFSILWYPVKRLVRRLRRRRGPADPAP